MLCPSLNGRVHLHVCVVNGVPGDHGTSRKQALTSGSLLPPCRFTSRSNLTFISASLFLRKRFNFNPSQPIAMLCTGTDRRLSVGKTARVWIGTGGCFQWSMPPCHAPKWAGGPPNSSVVPGAIAPHKASAVRYSALPARLRRG